VRCSLEISTALNRNKRQSHAGRYSGDQVNGLKLMFRAQLQFVVRM